MPPKRLTTPSQASTTGASSGIGARAAGASTVVERLPAPFAEGSGSAGAPPDAPAMNTERRLSGRSSSSAVGPVKRTSPFSMNTARSAWLRPILPEDRYRVVYGQSVCVRVGLGRRGIIILKYYSYLILLHHRSTHIRIFS